MGGFERNADVVRVGLLALAAVAVFVVVFAWLTERSLGGERWPLVARFETAQGLKKGDPVLHRGVPVGEVQSLDFAADGGVLVRLELTRSVPLSSGARARLEAVDIFGSQSVALQDGPARGRPLVPGDTIGGVPAASLTARMEELGDRAQRLMSDTTVHLIQSTLAETGRASTELQRLIHSADRLLAAQTADMTRMTTDLAASSAHLRELTGHEDLERVISNLERASANLVGMTGQGERAMRSLASLMDKIDRGEGTAGRLVNDDALYDQLLAASTDLDRLLLDLQANPKRYLGVSVF